MSHRPSSDAPKLTAQVKNSTWKSWGGHLSVTPSAIVRPENTDQVVQVLRDAARQQLRVRAAGSGRSSSALVPTSDVILDTSALTGLSSIDVAKQQVTVFGGTTLHEIAQLLESYGLALANMPDCAAQTIAGAIATGTHGTGLGQPSLAQQVVAVTLITPTGELITCSETSRPELLRAARTHLGVLGVIVSVTLRCVDSFRLHCSEFREPVASLVESLGERMAGVDHFEFSWMPGGTVAHTRVLSRLHRLPGNYTRPASPVSRALRRADDAVLRTSMTSGLGRLATVVPGAVTGLNRLESMAVSSRSYTDLSQRVFAAPRAVRYVFMEYALPLENTSAALRELQHLVDRQGYTLSYPVVVRCSPPEQAYLSPSEGRYTGWISLRQYGKRDHEEFFRAAEKIFLAHGGRPHWGSVHFQKASTLRPMYPHWEDFLTARAELDPDGRLLNDYVRDLLGL